MTGAIAREQQIKGGSRAKKMALIEARNEAWPDLYPGLVDGAVTAEPVGDLWLASLLAVTGVQTRNAPRCYPHATPGE
jgi:hypothetical protein